MGSVSDAYDIVIVGAGLSGLNSAYRIQQTLPDVRYTILEGCDTIGGTWAFWKYPGARSDSNTAVFRFAWHPWPDGKSFPLASEVQAYVEDAARTQGINKHIQLHQQVGARRWSSEEQMWTLDVTDKTTGTQRLVKAQWLINCSGYYSYDKALQATIPGLNQFRGEVVHPQFWRDDISLAGKRVVLIGSGATAVTMLPQVAEQAKHVTMLQRSPSYVMSMPTRDRGTAFLQRLLPRRLADAIDWWRQAVLEHIFVWFLLTFPNAGRRFLIKLMRRALPKDYPLDVHFNPRYPPFDQRLCFCPDGDFFEALHKPNCELVTDSISTVTADGIWLVGSGGEIKCDMIVTATGLHLQLLNGTRPIVDGVAVDVGQRYAWRSCMLDGVPNTCFIMGYTVGTWTPGADVHIGTVLGVIKEMRRQGATSATPTLDPARREALPKLPALPNSSTYLVKARDRLPMSSGRYPFLIGLTYFADLWYNWVGNPRDGMRYIVPDKKGV